MYALIFLAAGGSVWLNDTLEADSVATNLLNTSWLLAPYLVLITVMVGAEKRTSFLAIAVATLFGAVGALTSAVMMPLFEGGISPRLVPIYQAGAIVALVSACRWLVARIDVKP